MTSLRAPIVAAAFIVAAAGMMESPFSPYRDCSETVLTPGRSAFFTFSDPIFGPPRVTMREYGDQGATVHYEAFGNPLVLDRITAHEGNQVVLYDNWVSEPSLFISGTLDFSSMLERACVRR